MAGAEQEKKSRVNEPEFLEKFRTKLAERIENNSKIPEEVAIKVLCGEKIKSNFSISEALNDVGREAGLSSAEIEKLREEFFE